MHGRTGSYKWMVLVLLHSSSIPCDQPWSVNCGCTEFIDVDISPLPAQTFAGSCTVERVVTNGHKAIHKTVIHDLWPWHIQEYIEKGTQWLHTYYDLWSVLAVRNRCSGCLTFSLAAISHCMRIWVVCIQDLPLHATHAFRFLRDRVKKHAPAHTQRYLLFTISCYRNAVCSY